MDQVAHKRGLSEAEAAKYLGLSRSTLRQGRMNGSRLCRVPPPPYAKLGRKIVYLRDDLDRYLEAHRQGELCGGEANRGA